ncbi:sulfatase family protein [Pontiella desulfatans]|nr:sulfatase [Pontiella desulfatans]
MNKLLSVVAGLVVALSAGAEKPNILFIMSDDHTWQAVGAYHSRFAYLNPTPNIDALAEKGVVFENAFCGNAICTPSRASIMTGQYSHKNGALTLDGELEKERQFLALEMKKAGYQTAVVGKWHLKALPEAFDYYKVLPGQGNYFDPVFYETGGGTNLIKMTGHSSDCVMDSALSWFKEKRDPETPFFLKLHFKAPHDYFENAPRYDSYLEKINMPEPLSLWERGTGSMATRGYDGELDQVLATSIGRRNFRRSYDVDFEVDPNLDDVAAKREAYNIYMKKYFRCVKGVDDNLGRLFQYMEKEGLMDNTVIMYTGDQGFFLGEHDMQDKRWAYEPSFRMPFIAYYPKSIVPGRTDAIIENVDYPVTMLDYAGIALPDYMQGRSFRSVLDQGTEPEGWKQEAYYQYWMHMAHHDVPGHIAMRTKRYKLILFHGTQGTTGFGSERSEHATPPAWELYDLKNDPNEMVNVYDDPAYADVIPGLKDQFKALRKRIKADDPSIAPNKPSQERMEAVNAVIDEYWDYSPEDRQKAIRISKDYLEQFGDPATCKKYLAPWLRPDDLDPSEM